MKSRSIAFFVSLALAGGAAAAQAESLSDHFSVELFAGENVGMPGSFRADKPPAGENPSREYGQLDFSSAYDHRYTGGAELDYSFDERLTGFARAAYSSFNGRLTRSARCSRMTATHPSRRASATTACASSTSADATHLRRVRSCGPSSVPASASPNSPRRARTSTTSWAAVR